MPWQLKRTNFQQTNRCLRASPTPTPWADPLPLSSHLVTPHAAQRSHTDWRQGQKQEAINNKLELEFEVSALTEGILTSQGWVRVTSGSLLASSCGPCCCQTHTHMFMRAHLQVLAAEMCPYVIPTEMCAHAHAAETCHRGNGTMGQSL